MKRLSILILNVFITLITVSGQDIVVTASFDTSAIYIGDQIKYTIKVDQPDNVTLSLPSFRDTLAKNIDIIAGPVSDSVKKDGRIILIDQYLITSFDSGFYQLSPVYAELKNEEGIRRFYSDYTQLEVMRVKIAPADTTAKIFDIIEPYRAPVTVGEMLPWILAALLLGAIIWLVVRYIKRIRSSKSPEEIIINPDPAHVTAFRELEKLREEQLWQNGEIKYYYTRLTEILRQYLENRFGVFSLELTTSETLDALIKSGFKKDASYNMLKAILTGADLVKFAKHKPEVEEHELHFQNSWDFVKATKEDEMLANEAAVSENRKEEEV